tara:strand:+ start:903 stop:1772 length:870 start_codon:yes stop_codon:yes gene_type:complete
MTNKHNPLSAHFRAPKLFTPLPSEGRFYDNTVVEMPETLELPVFSMTAKDEMIMKNPDALLNGEAVAQVIESCVPNVKNARAMMSSDIDVLLVAIQGATYGDEVEVTADCPECNEQQTGAASVEAAIETMGRLEEVYTVEHDTLNIEIRPFTYSSTIQAGITNFQSTRSLQALADVPDEMERLRLFNDNFKKIAELNFSLIIDSVQSITLADEEGEDIVVTDRDHIVEFLNNAENVVGKKIEEKIQDINSIGINHEMKMQCEKCVDEDGNPKTFESRVNFDPVNFFTAS